MSYDFKTLGPDMDFRQVVEAYVALPEGGDIALGLDFNPGEGKGYVIFGLGDVLYRITPDLALRLADYLDYASVHGGIDHPEGLQKMGEGIRAVANGLGYTVTINH